MRDTTIRITTCTQILTANKMELLVQRDLEKLWDLANRNLTRFYKEKWPVLHWWGAGGRITPYLRTGWHLTGRAVTLRRRAWALQGMPYEPVEYGHYEEGQLQMRLHEEERGPAKQPEFSSPSTQHWCVPVCGSPFWRSREQLESVEWRSAKVGFGT